MKYEVEITESALDDLDYLKKAEQNVILNAVDEQLTATPLTPTRNRKTLSAKRSFGLGDANRSLSRFL